MARWVAGFGTTGADAEVEFEPGTEYDPEVEDRMMGNLARFFTAEALPVVRYRPDLAALGAVADRLLIGVGAASGDQYPARAARALGAATGAPVAEFPSQHWGYLLRPRAFADALRAVLI
jgi:hypothetical protein